jgi:hypothetical protein
MPKSVFAMRRNASLISESETGSDSGTCSRVLSHAIARNQPSPNGTKSTTPSGPVAAESPSVGGCVSRTSASTANRKETPSLSCSSPTTFAP